LFFLAAETEIAKMYVSIVADVRTMQWTVHFADQTGGAVLDPSNAGLAARIPFEVWIRYYSCCRT